MKFTTWSNWFWVHFMNAFPIFWDSKSTTKLLILNLITFPYIKVFCRIKDRCINCFFSNFICEIFPYLCLVEEMKKQLLVYLKFNEFYSNEMFHYILYHFKSVINYFINIYINFKKIWSIAYSNRHAMYLKIWKNVVNYR